MTNKNETKKKNWVLVYPYFDEEKNLAGFTGGLELEQGKLQIGDAVCLHNDSTPYTEGKVYGTIVGETPFVYIMEVEGKADLLTNKKATYRKCVNKSTLLSSNTIRKLKEEKRKQIEKNRNKQ